VKIYPESREHQENRWRQERRGALPIRRHHADRLDRWCPQDRCLQSALSALRCPVRPRDLRGPWGPAGQWRLM